MICFFLEVMFKSTYRTYLRKIAGRHSLQRGSILTRFYFVGVGIAGVGKDSLWWLLTLSELTMENNNRTKHLCLRKIGILIYGDLRFFCMRETFYMARSYFCKWLYRRTMVISVHPSGYLLLTQHHIQSKMYNIPCRSWHVDLLLLSNHICGWIVIHYSLTNLDSLIVKCCSCFFFEIPVHISFHGKLRLPVTPQCHLPQEWWWLITP